MNCDEIVTVPGIGAFRLLPLVVLAVLIAMSLPARAQSSHEEGSDANLAQQLQNPIAALINVPFQNNFDFNAGRDDDGFGYTLNFQPIVPFRLSEDWTLITRTIVPFTHLERYTDSVENGMGDITQSFFLSPRIAAAGLTAGFGPAVLYPSATNSALVSRQWAAGPTGVLVQQIGPWTLGALANHLWAVADSGDRGARPRVNQTLVQPFVSYTFGGGFSLIATSETSYDWTGRNWTVPIDAGFTQLVKLGDLPVNLGFQARWYAAAPEDGPEWGLRFVATFVFK